MPSIVLITWAAVGASTRTQILCAGGLLLVLWIGLPIRIARSARGPSIAECLTLADRPPGNATSIPSLERCAALLPNDTELLADLGGQYEAAGRLDEAGRLYQQALAVDPLYADVRLRLGHLLLRRGQPAEAARQAEAALRVQPNRKALADLADEAARAGMKP